MRQDRLSALRQRLKRGSFEFGALLEGVSTLEEDPPRTDDRRPPARTDEDRIPELNGAAVPVPPVELENLAAPESSPATVLAEEPLTDSAQHAFALLPDSISIPQADKSHSERLRAALDSLGCRFLQEVGSLKAALAEGDVEEGGFHLAHLNQVLELLRDIDPDGEIARKHGTVAAPPSGRSWPASSWTVVEFAASPFSALLPPRADARFASDLLYAAWGVTFTSQEHT